MQITLACDAFRSRLLGVARFWCRKDCGFSPSRASHAVSVLYCGSFPSSLEFVSVILEERSASASVAIVENCRPSVVALREGAAFSATVA